MKAHKDKIRVIIFTPEFKIKGDLHLYENSRLSDILNADTVSKDFLPITEVKLLDQKDNLLQEVSFLSLNKNQIVLVMEDDEANALLKAKEFLEKRRYQEALEFAKRAIKATPNVAEAHYVLGFCLAKLNDKKGAKTAFEECLKLYPDGVTAHKVQEMLGTLKA
ncbi:tetratricopeptide repeat protein [bacterium]|nr:tetratricopeptide repeat protein [bacterium]